MTITPAPPSSRSSGELPPPPPPPRRLDPGRVVAALILIALGVVFLFGNLAATGFATGGALFIGLGLAFAVGRFVTNGYGLAVPAGVLLGFGSFVALSENRLLPGEDGGWFFVMLGLGFVAVYLIGLRPTAIWPLVLAAILGGFGTLLLGLIDTAPLAQYAWIATYWPLVLVGIGLWLLLRNRLPPPARRVLSTIGIILIVLYGLLAFAATVALATGPATGEIGRSRVGWPFPGAAPLAETVTLTAPVGAGDTLTVVNTSGSSTVRAGGGEVRVVATKHFWARGQEPQVTLGPGSGGLTLEISQPSGRPWPVAFGAAPSVDYVVEVPAGLPLTVHSASGAVEVRGLIGAVTAETSSGRVALADLSGPVSVRTNSGDVTLAGVTGEARVATSSGDVRGDGLLHLREVTTASGDMTLSGRFDGNARLQTSSGDVQVRFAPDSDIRVAVSTSSGDIQVRDLPLTNPQHDRRSLTGSLGAGSATLTIATSSGDVTLSRQ